MLKTVKSVGKFVEEKALKVAVTGGAVLGSMSANAAFDVSGITGALADIAAIGAAVFAVYVAIKLFNWARRAL